MESNTMNNDFPVCEQVAEHVVKHCPYMNAIEKSASHSIPSEPDNLIALGDWGSLQKQLCNTCQVFMSTFEINEHRFRFLEVVPERFSIEVLL